MFTFPANRLISLLFAAFLLSACSPEAPSLINGKQPPGFSVSDLKGEQKSFPEDYAGRVVVVRFWADWCPFCESEMKQIEPVYQANKEKGLEILAVNVRQTQPTAKAFMDKLNVSYPGLLDEDGEVARQYGVLGLPTTFVVDRKGILQTRIIGESTAEVLESVVQELL